LVPLAREPQAVVVLRMEVKKPVQKALELRELESGPAGQALTRAAEQEQEEPVLELLALVQESERQRAWSPQALESA
jgi:hypothetical protein